MREVGKKLQLLLEQQMQVRVRAGADKLMPKHHWCFDIAECLVQHDDPMLLDTFGTERLHLRVNMVAENCKNIGVFDEYVLAGVTNAHAHPLTFAGAVDPVHLVGPTSRMPGAPNILLASACQNSGEHLHVGDVCFRGLPGGWFL